VEKSIEEQQHGRGEERESGLFLDDEFSQRIRRVRKWVLQKTTAIGTMGAVRRSGKGQRRSDQATTGSRERAHTCSVVAFGRVAMGRFQTEARPGTVQLGQVENRNSNEFSFIMLIQNCKIGKEYV
jgi:hypothetical protein